MTALVIAILAILPASLLLLALMTLSVRNGYPYALTLVLANGAYGLRAAKTVGYLGRGLRLLDKGDYLPPRGAEVAAIYARIQASEFKRPMA